jgi:DNA-directed RNA polymerase specialized sigma24 family protein
VSWLGLTHQEALDLDDMIRRTVKRVTWDFASIDPEDLAQSLWEEVLISKVAPSQPGLRKHLYRRAKAIAWTIRKEQLRISAQYSYRTEDVKLILETVFDDYDWIAGYVPQDAREGEHDSMAVLEVRMDVLIAFRQLPPQYQKAIEDRYVLGITPEPGGADHKRLSRAIKRLAEYMNSYYSSSQIAGRPGSRRVITNHEANYILQNQEGNH